MLVLSHVRSCGILTTEQGGQKISVHTDRGAEFFSGSKRKMQEWNDLLSLFPVSTAITPTGISEKMLSNDPTAVMMMSS